MDIGNISAYTDYYTQLAGNLSSEKLSGALSADKIKTSTDDELMDACKQFESYLLEMVFKEMEKTVMKAEEGDSATTSLVDFFKENTIQELSKQSTDTNSLGLAQMLYDQLKRNVGITPEELAQHAAEQGVAQAE